MKIRRTFQGLLSFIGAVLLIGCGGGDGGGSSYTVTANAGASGIITPESQRVDAGRTADFTVTAEPGYSASVSGCNGTLLNDIYTTGPINADCAITATFYLKTYTVTATAGAHGGIDPGSRMVDHGSTASFTVTPEAGYSASVTGCNGTLSGNTYTTGPITGECAVTANFAINTYTVTASVDAAGGGSIVVPTTRTVNYGAATAFTLVPSTGYHVAGVTGCGGTLAGDIYATGAITTNCTVTVSFAQNVYTVTGSAGPNGSISPAMRTVNHGERASFTITPAAGYHVGNVTGCAVGLWSGTTYTTGPVTAACSVNVTFEINTYTVAGVAGAGGTISPVTRSVAHGSTTTFTVTPNTGYYLTGVTGCGGTLAGNIYTTGAITSDCTVTASFAPYVYTVTASTGANGTITPDSRTIDYGTTAVFTVIPETGYNATVTGCGGTLSDTTYTTGPITADCAVTANFTLKTYAVTATAGAHGIVEAPLVRTIPHGYTTTFNLVPDTGYHVTTVTGCGGTLSGDSYTTGPITGNCTVTAADFAIDYYSVTASAGTGGSITPLTQTVQHGLTTAFTVSVDSGYGIQEITGCGGTFWDSTYTTAPVTTDCAVSAVFAPGYTVGGLVSGLASGTSVVLRNNDIDPITITANGRFSFPRALVSGSTYSVTVFNQPSDQRCTITAGSGTVGTADVSDMTVTCVNGVFPLYPRNGINWNDYVVNDGTTPFNALDNACTGNETGGYFACIHGGERRSFRVEGFASCTGVTASDALGAFNWTCDESPGYVRVVSTGLKGEKNLSDLIDFTAGTWKNNSVTVTNGTTTVTSPQARWWTNPVVVSAAGVNSGVAGTIYILPANGNTYARGGSFLLGEKTGLVIQPGLTYLCEWDYDSTSCVRAGKFSWLEGKLLAVSDTRHVGFDLSGGFSVLRNAQAKNFEDWGIYVDANNNMLSGVGASSSVLFDAIRIIGSGNIVKHVRAANIPQGHGLYVSGDDNTVSDVTVSLTYRGISMVGSRNVLMDATVVDNRYYGTISLAGDRNFISRVTAIRNHNGISTGTNSWVESATISNSGFGLAAGLGSTAQDVTLWSNSYAFYASSSLRVQGLLQEHHYNSQSDCYLDCPSFEYATVINGISLEFSFAGQVMTDDPVNPSDVPGVPVPISDISDWTNFSNPFRTWGVDELVWDWSLSSVDTVNRNAFSLPTGNDADPLPFGTGYRLRHAAELTGDGDGFCESNETCLFTPNIGAYQGHGALVPAGTFFDGIYITGVTLLRYETNGR